MLWWYVCKILVGSIVFLCYLLLCVSIKYLWDIQTSWCMSNPACISLGLFPSRDSWHSNKNALGVLGVVWGSVRKQPKTLSSRGISHILFDHPCENGVIWSYYYYCYVLAKVIFILKISSYLLILTRLHTNPLRPSIISDQWKSLTTPTCHQGVASCF